MKTFRWATSAAAFLLLGISVGQAKDITIGLASEPTAADPHYHDVSPNNALADHIFSALGVFDENQIVKPGLAKSWKPENDHTWVFNLRDDVKFSDGSDFNADDVIFTFCRVMNNEGSVNASFSDDVRNFASVEAPDSHTLRITTKAVEPLLPELLSEIAILSDRIVDHGKISFDLANKCGVTGAWPGIDDFNTGKAAIGTGPFVLSKFDKGASITLSRNASYFGKAPEWEHVKFVPVPAAGPRLAGLLSGDYDVIEGPAARDIAQIKQRPELDYTSKPSSRVIFLQMDIGRDHSPFVETKDGSNPLQDERVRKAMSMAIDRQAIVDRIMDGFAEPAYQFVPTTMSGALADPKPIKYDPEGAKKLLAEAGYPNGFGLTLHATNDRYINDSQVAQAVAQYLTRVGIKAKVDAMNGSIFFTRRAKRDFSFAMGGWGSTQGGAASFLRQYVTTDNDELGIGASNYGAWSDPAFDHVLVQAISTVDETKRAELLRQATQMAVDKVGFIPLHFESTLWAFRKGLHYTGRMDQYTLAFDITSDKAN
ncbi:ABC transporter substrate-binding protein [Rhizobium sp. P32RR-XVIII]|uniref:ABC transporter substrate-binding protein n=1 Tax=Rhizobium sp. P32RR-XVIII TaxID=2726738 RepID=UPI0019810F8A|nr:ABC transporter substrate-binding protein [Rhizobium sp. P32RR-XVIII]